MLVRKAHVLIASFPRTGPIRGAQPGSVLVCREVVIELVHRIGLVLSLE